jgi:hypothetical protein
MRRPWPTRGCYAMEEDEERDDDIDVQYKN